MEVQGSIWFCGREAYWIRYHTKLWPIWHRSAFWHGVTMGVRICLNHHYNLHKRNCPGASVQIFTSPWKVSPAKWCGQTRSGAFLHPLLLDGWRSPHWPICAIGWNLLPKASRLVSAQNEIWWTYDGLKTLFKTYYFAVELALQEQINSTFADQLRNKVVA